MAQLHELKTHEDSFPDKRKITKEEVEFLKQLQKRLNTQDNLGQADPKYWVIRDYDKIYGKDLNNSNGFCIIDTYTCEPIIDSDEINDIRGNLDVIIEKVRETLSESEREGFIIDDEYGDFNPQKWKENVVDVSYNLESFIENLNAYVGEENGEAFTLLESQEYPRDSNCFLSNEEAQNFLKRNDHHFSDKAHTYAETAWRNPEMEKLVKILHEVDFDLLL